MYSNALELQMEEMEELRRDEMLLLPDDIDYNKWVIEKLRLQDAILDILLRLLSTIFLYWARWIINSNCFILFIVDKKTQQMSIVLWLATKYYFRRK